MQEEYCLKQGDRILVAIASYTQSGDGLLSTVLKSLNHARELFGIDMEILLDLTDALSFEPPVGLKVKTTIHDRAVGFDLAGKFRWKFDHALQANDGFDYFLMTENDINITAQNLDSLCADWQFLASYQSAENGTATQLGGKYMPGLMRYETKSDDASDNTKWLAEVTGITGPQIKDIVTLHGRKFVIPTNEYAACWFLPAYRLKEIIDSLATTNYPWLAEDPRSFGDIRAWHAGIFLELFGEIKIVPLDNFRSYLVHHLSNKYVRMPDNPFLFYVESEAFIEGTSRYNGTSSVFLCHSDVRCDDLSYYLKSINGSAVKQFGYKHKGIYIIVDGQKRLIPNMDTLNFLHVDMARIIQLSDNTFKVVPEGEWLPACQYC